jgi:YARHG domain
MKNIIVALISILLFANCGNTPTKSEDKPITEVLDSAKVKLLNRELDVREKELAHNKKQLEFDKNNAAPIEAGELGKYPEGSERLLTIDDMKHLSKWELRIMRNEIFARHNAIFNDQELQNYFGKQVWYMPEVPTSQVELTSIEKQNIDFIKVYEN